LNTGINEHSESLAFPGTKLGVQASTTIQEEGNGLLSVVYKMHVDALRVFVAITFILDPFTSSANAGHPMTVMRVAPHGAAVRSVVAATMEPATAMEAATMEAATTVEPTTTVSTTTVTAATTTTAGAG
jgi:hypothetical protein